MMKQSEELNVKQKQRKQRSNVTSRVCLTVVPGLAALNGLVKNGNSEPHGGNYGGSDTDVQP